MNQALERRFLRAAGAAGPIRLLLRKTDNDAGGATLEYEQPFIVVGANRRADLRLDHPDISQRHLYLQLVDGRLFGVHLSTRVPTHWGEETRAAGWIDVGTTLGLGPFQVQYLGMGGQSEAQGVPAREPTVSGSFSGPPVTLELVREMPGASKVTLSRIVTLLGNSPLCKMRINSSRTSSVHCSLVRTDDGLWVVDLCSREGIKVNESSVRMALLGEGDILEIGGRRLMVRYPSQAHAAGPDPAGVIPSEEPVAFQATEIELSRRAPLQDAKGSSNRTDLEAMDKVLGPIFDRIANYQAQSFEQVQEMMATMMRMFGAMFTEHREFVKEEMERFERVTRALAENRPVETRDTSVRDAESEKEAKADAAKAAWSAPLPPLPTGPGSEQVHAWLQNRIDQLDEQRASFWRKMFGGSRPEVPAQPPN